MDNWVTRPWRQALVLRGRATRRECAALYVETVALFFVLLFVSGSLAGAPRGSTVAVTLDVVWLLYYAVTLVVTLTASVRRLHDQDRPGWLCLLSFVPVIGWAFFLVFMLLMPGTPGPNRYGHDPRQGAPVDPRRLGEVFS